jgi:ribosomal protein S24E
MELNKISKTDKPLLKRSEFVYTVAASGATPSRAALAQAIGAQEKGTVVVTHIYPATGAQAARVHARVYHDAATAGTLERANLLTKQKPKGEAPAETP